MAQLLVEASTLPCLLEEQHQIVCLLAAYDRWLVSTMQTQTSYMSTVKS